MSHSFTAARWGAVGSVMLLPIACTSVLGVADYEKGAARPAADASPSEGGLPEAAPPDAAQRDAGPRGIVCDTVSCALGTACCSSSFDSWLGSKCGADKMACLRNAQQALECDDTTDCPRSQVCCASVGAGRVSGATCRDVCAGDDETLCDPSNPASCASQAGTSCQPATFSGGLIWLFACR